MRNAATRIVLAMAAVLVLIGLHWYERRVLDPRRERLLGYEESLPRAIQHSAEYDVARAAGEQPFFTPGEKQGELTDLPARTLALSLGGLRGAFSIYLWMQAENEKNARMHEDLLDRYYRIANFQPDYPSVWAFNAWNLAYNISVQFSTEERRYEWVRYGINYLEEGIRRNPDSVELLETMGRIYYWKIANNTNQADRRYFSQRIEEDDGASPLQIAYMWYARARQVQEETGNRHPTFPRRTLSSQACHAMHQYAKTLTEQALNELLEATELEQAGKRPEAKARLEQGHADYEKAMALWQATIEEWQKQLQLYPDDYNAVRFGGGAAESLGIMRRQLPYLTASYLEGNPGSLAVRIRSMLVLESLIRAFKYTIPERGEIFGPVVR